MRLGIMQPYFLPYIGYFQLLNIVDEFVVYDNIEFTKKGWINRNRILVNGTDSYITLPLKKDSDYLPIQKRYLADTWLSERKKILNRIFESYKKAPHFDSVYPIIEQCLLNNDINLFGFILNSIETIAQYLNISTSLIISSSLDINHNLKSEKKAIAICKAKQADVYINLAGGMDLYNKLNFANEGIDLLFIRSGAIRYKQYNNDFIPSLSIIDVMMFNGIDEIKLMLNNYELV